MLKRLNSRFLGQDSPAFFIAGIFFLLAALYSFVTPIFESPDELWHYPFVWHLARTAELPVQDPANPQLYAQEASQPPLYYALAALLTAPIPSDDLPALIYHNPHADIGWVRADGNANIVVHTEAEAWPWSGAVLAIHLARLFSVLLGTGTVIVVYRLGRTLWPDQSGPALFAMAFVAFNPMFLFISGSINNDNLITLLASVVIWQLAAMVTAYPGSRPATPPLRRYLVLGLLIGLAALTKVSGLGLLGLAGLTLSIWGSRRRSWRIAILGNVIITVTSVAIAGWWYWRNFRLYGDWTGTENMVLMMGARPVTPTAGQLLAEIPGFLRSFWGLFGYFSVPMPSFTYTILNFLLLAGGIGLLTALRRPDALSPQFRQTWPILVGWLLILMIGLIQWTLRTPATQGRLLFPAIAAIAVLYAAGWQTLVPKRVLILPAIFMAGLAFWVPWGVIGPAYAQPTLGVAPPPAAPRLDVTFDEGPILLAYEVGESNVKPGESLSITLYWQSEQPIDRDYTVFVHLLDQNEIVVAQRNLFHGLGLYPTSQWHPNQPFADTYVLQLPRTTYAPTEARFEVGVYDHTTGSRLLNTLGQDQVRFGQVSIQPYPGDLPNPQSLRFEDGIVLAGYSLDNRQVAPGDGLTLTLYWQAQRTTPSQNYKIFVHLVDERDFRAAQHDSEPQNGARPTSVWVSNQTIVDQHSLTISPEAPPGVYRLKVGLYDAATGQRLRLLEDDGAPVQADSIILSQVRILNP